MAHAALREIVERAVEEARKLPGLDAPADGEQPREGCAIADRSYEDLLATAILNKVVFQADSRREPEAREERISARRKECSRDYHDMLQRWNAKNCCRII